jgi:glycosyltransferase involved in cell wall biosynthesis
MKILLIGPVYPYRGGIAHYTTLLAKALQTAGHEVKVISFKRQYPKWLYPGQSDRDPSQSPLTVPAAYILDPIYPWTWHRAVVAIRQEKPDLVLFQWWTTFWSFAFAFIAKALQKHKICIAYLIHNVIPHEARPWDRFLAKMALGAGNAFLVQSQGQKSALLSLIPTARVELVEHPVYDMFSEQKMDQNEARQRLGLPKDLPIILFFGIVRPYKGLGLLIEAIGELFTEGQQVGLYIAGEFWEDVEKYKEQIKRLNLDGQVWIDNRYIPNEELPAIFSAADIFAAPYTNATQSGAIKMALGFGMPIIASEAVVEAQSITQNLSIKVIPSSDCLSLKKAIQLWLRKDWIPQNGQPITCDWASVLDKILWLVK